MDRLLCWFKFSPASSSWHGRRPKHSFHVDGSSLGSWEETTSDESNDRDDEFVRVEVGDSRENLATVGILKINFGNNNMQPRKDSLTDSSSSKLERVQVLEKKLVAKGKGEKVPEKKLRAKVNGEKVPEKKLVVKEKRVKIALRKDGPI
uniref:Uncharacterized protein n=1 Tax=Quercus lobata TaxID=97700 RepID=A0A7N2L9X7_QUELO